MVKSYSFFTTAEEEYRRDPKIKREDVKALQHWASRQTHLPQISELKMIGFLHSNYYKIEATKQCIERYYTIRANCDEIFNNHDVSAKDLRDACQMLMSNLLVSTPEHKIVLCGIKEPNPDLMRSCGPIYCFFDIMNHIFYAQHGVSDDHIIIVDGSNVRFYQIMRLAIIPTKILMYYVQQAVPIRLKVAHVVNVSPAVEKLYAFFKPLIKGDLMDKVILHRNIEDLYKHVPKDCLPKDLGGEGPSYDDLHAEQIKLLEANAKWVEALGKERADESKRQKKINFGDMFGFEGTFKRLEID